MSFIKKYDIYLPQHSIADNLLHPRSRKNMHSVAYVDEDIITLAYTAACNLGTDADAILFATTTPVFKNRYHASFLADLLGLPEGIFALDMGMTNRAGTDALILADTLISSGKHENVLVVAADIRFPAIGGETRTPFGHGAVAMIVSKENGIARICNTASYSAAVAEEFTYKGEHHRYDARFARTAGFKNNMSKVLAELTPKDVDSLIINSAFVKLLFNSLKKNGYDLKNQVASDNLVARCGYLGVAHGLLRLINAIENSTGISVLIDYNNGSNVIEVDVPNKCFPVIGDITHKTAITTYHDYLTIRKQNKFESITYKPIEIFSSEMMQEREKDQLQGLRGFKCESCGTVYYLKSARCKNCRGTKFGEQQLSKSGTVYSLTGEYYFPSSFPPTHMIIIDLDGGGRITVQQTDDMYQTEENTINIGDKVELVLRKMMENDMKPNYFWKCIKK